MVVRIVSLIASSTEIVHALGFGDQMVGRSHECDFPTQVKELPVCTGPKFKTDGTSYEIDQRVKEIVQESLSVYRVDAEKLNELKPTHIITQAQCEVCAVSLKDVEEAACQIISSNPQIISLQPDSLADIFEDVRRIAKGLGVVPVGEMMVAQLKSRMEAVSQKARALPNKPRVALVEWIEPMMAGGNWMPELIDMAGGINLFGEAGKHSPWMNWEDLVAAEPDIIIVSPCGFDIERTMQEMHLISDRKEYAGLQAVKNGKVFVADGNQYFNRPGPRVLESLEMLAEMLHPEEFKFAHEGVGWIRYSPKI
ncbi:MAG TPA: cobalamin-binding protein [Candidatus Melainabacteria bacterium]|nr:cobalamin-binding protein [Candidatus Melainabacteria bacterium]HIN63771.1 cobalamin-binding protein [Candidatus Obscuribacterales bacterium]